MSCRLIAAERPGKGLGDSTGKSVPNASFAPVFSIDLPGIGAFEAVGAEPLLGHQPVAGLMGRLHRGDDARRRRCAEGRRRSTIWACSIRQRRSRAVFLSQLLVGADDLRIGRIADRVGRDLEAVRRPPVSRERSNLGVGMELQPARVRLVGVGLLQPRAARAERAVGEELDADRAQPIAVEPWRSAAARP